MSDYHATVKIRNGRLLAAMRSAGCKTVADLSRLSGVAQTQLGKLLNMSISARCTNSGQWCAPAIHVSNALRCLPEDLFNEQQATTSVEQTSFEAFVDEAGLAALSGMGGPGGLEQVDIKETLAGLMKVLDPRAQAICLALAEGSTLDEVGGEWSITRERVRQIHTKSIRQMTARSKNALCDVPRQALDRIT